MDLRSKDQKTTEHRIDLSKFLTQNIGKMQPQQKNKLYKLHSQLHLRDHPLLVIECLIMT